MIYAISNNGHLHGWLIADDRSYPHHASGDPDFSPCPHIWEPSLEPFILFTSISTNQLELKVQTLSWPLPVKRSVSTGLMVSSILIIVVSIRTKSRGEMLILLYISIVISTCIWQVETLSEWQCWLSLTLKILLHRIQCFFLVHQFGEGMINISSIRRSICSAFVGFVSAIMTEYIKVFGCQLDVCCPPPKRFSFKVLLLSLWFISGTKADSDLVSGPSTSNPMIKIKIIPCASMAGKRMSFSRKIFSVSCKPWLGSDSAEPLYLHATRLWKAYSDYYLHYLTQQWAPH